MVCPTRGALFSGTSGTGKGKLIKGKERDNLLSTLPEKQNKGAERKSEDEQS
jgi:hypothetical protein